VKVGRTSGESETEEELKQSAGGRDRERGGSETEWE